MAKDWVPCFGYGITAGVQVGPGPTRFVLPLVGTGLGLDPAGNQVGVPDTDPEEMLVHRTVGQVHWRNISLDQAEIRVSMRFTTALYNQTLGSLFPFTLDLDSGADANESFMTEKRFALTQPEVDTRTIFAEPWNSFWDVTSKRKLQSSQWTCIVVQLDAIAPSTGGIGFVALTHYLRSWVTTSQ